MDRMTVKDLKGLAVISIAEGAKVGSINRVYLDPEARRIIGFSVEPGGNLLEPDSRKLIDVDDIHSLGPDAMTLADKGAVRGDQTNERWMSLVDLDDLTKQKVVTEGGEYVGQVSTIEFDRATFGLVGIEVSPGFFKGHMRIAIDDVTTIGPELVMVADSVCAPQPEPAAETTEDRPWVVEESVAEGRQPESSVS